jgi:hypothetical protein
VAISKRDAAAIAKFRGGLIIQSALDAGWWPDDLEDEYGEDGVREIVNQLHQLASRLTGGQ